MNSNNIKDLFERIPEKYEKLSRIFSFGINLWWRFKASKYAKGQVLDLCCGTGESIYAFQKNPEVKKIYGLDFSKNMLLVAKKRGLKNLVIGNAVSLPFKSKSFDTVSCIYSLRNIEDKENLFSEVFRVLKDNGSFIALDMSMPISPLRPIYWIYLSKIMPVLSKLWKMDPEDYVYLANSIKAFEPGRIKKALYKAGFEKVLVKSLTFESAALFYAKK